MLQIALANPANRMIAATQYRRVLIVLGAVIGAHLALLILTFAARDRTVEPPVEPRTITAVLLSPEPEPTIPAAPAAVVPPTPPAAAAHPVVRARPAPQPSPRVTHSTPTPARITPTVPPQSVEPSPTAQPAPVAAPPMPAALVTASAPAAERTVPASTTPKNVSHVDCAIPKPDYPDISKRRGENGTAVVRFVVGLTGRIDTVQLQKSSGYERLDDAALAAVHASVCQPYSENGAVVRAAYSQSFVFGLTD